MTNCLYEQHEKIKEIENNVYQKFENSIKKIEIDFRNNNEQNKTNLESLKEYFDLEFRKSIEKIDIESECREKIIQNLIQQMNNEFSNVHNNV